MPAEAGARRARRLAALGLCALAALAGCGDGDEVVVVTRTLPTTAPPPTSTVPTTAPPPPTAPTTPTGPVLGGAVLHQEDWNAGDGGWPEPASPRSRAGWDGERMAYRVIVDVPQVRRQVLAPPRDLPADVRIQVRAALVEGGEDDFDYRGVVCRAEAGVDSYYGFLVRSDGSAAIARYREDERVLLGEGRFVRSDAIRTGRGAENTIAAECVGNRLTLSVNDQQVVTATDDRLTGNRVGLTASGGDDGKKVHVFDDIVVTG